MTDEYEEMYVSSHYKFNNKKLLREHSLEVGLTENLDWSIVLCYHLHAITILFCGGKIGLIYSTSFSSIHDDMNLRISLTLSQVNFFVTSKHLFYHFHYTLCILHVYFYLVSRKYIKVFMSPVVAFKLTDRHTHILVDGQTERCTSWQSDPYKHRPHEK